MSKKKCVIEITLAEEVNIHQSLIFSALWKISFRVGCTIVDVSFLVIHIMIELLSAGVSWTFCGAVFQTSV